jgi:hypothetical protein
MRAAFGQFFVRQYALGCVWAVLTTGEVCDKIQVSSTGGKHEIPRHSF